MGDLKYRERLSSSVDIGLYKAIYNQSILTKIPLSRLLDDAIEDYLKKNHIEYEIFGPYKKELKK